MQFTKASRMLLEQTLAKKVKNALGHGSVALIVPGGSNISSVIACMSLLSSNDNSGLTLMLSDERYGPIDHENSNYFQMKQKGLNLYGAKFVQTLTGTNMDDTVRYYDKTVETLITSSETTIAFMGIGDDGHIAGILPNSLATKVEQEWVVGYHSKDFKRITLTPYALTYVDEVIVGAFGSEKITTLNNLQKTSRSIVDQPAQLLRSIPLVTIYNDEIG